MRYINKFINLAFKSLIFICSLVLVVGCTSPTTSLNSTAEGVNQTRDIYQSLSITPQPNNQLCWNDGSPYVDDWDEFIANPVFDEGLASELIAQNDTTQVIGLGTYQVVLNTSIQFTYRGYYHSTNPESTGNIRYIALLNEVQLPTAFDDENLPYQDMVFNYHETQTFNITIPPLTEGIHEFAIIGIQQTDLSNLGRAGVFAIRTTLIAGNPPVAVDRTAYEIITPTEQRNNQNATTYWSLSLHSDQTHLVWVGGDIYKPSINQLDFFMSVGYMEDVNKLTQRNITPQPQPIALIALLDYVQVPIQTDKLVFYGLLTPDNSYSYIPASIDVRDYSGKKELLVIQISYPRIPYCLLTPPPIEQGGHFFYFGVDVRRHGVDVQN